IALAPGLVTHILGPKWEGTVPVIRILALVNIVGLLGDTVVPLLKGIGQPSKVAAATGSQTAVLVAVMWFFTGYWGVGGAALAWLPAIAVSQVIIIKYLYDLLPHPFAGLLKPAGIVVLVSLSGAAIAMKIYEMLPNLFGLIGAAAASTAFIGVMLWIFERRLSLGLLDDLAQVFPRLANRIGYHPGKL
ncbi:MAG: polysaccharide biosynthesis C-terminal domain-containing protein, partial [Calditrichaeota bacterium]|nr:polysaccharide biosynthesis C-terminal domain-containing protein [Calditrichota bacterium]